MADKIRAKWQEFHKYKIKLDKMKLKTLLTRFIGRIVSYGELSVPVVFSKWAKNTRLLALKESGTVIQDFCRDIKTTIKIMNEYKLYKKIGVGLDKLDTIKFGLKWAFDNIRNEAKNNGLANLINLLQNKFDDTKREVLMARMGKK